MTFPRFLVAGALNTVLTYALYLAALVILPYRWAYSLAYAIGIGVGYVLNAAWVFGRRPQLHSARVYPFACALNYGIGLSLLWILVEAMGVSPKTAPVIVVLASTPCMYVLMRSLFREKAAYEPQDKDQRVQDSLAAEDQ